MIPLQLQIKNFLSYGSQTQTIHFEPYKLICLSGKNGHGKSALFDAITWALWGQARKTGGPKSDEGLIRLGQSQMMVSLDFSVQNTTYRVRREYSAHGGKVQTHLDVGIIDPTTRVFKSLTDKTIRGTQEKINTIVGLDYEAFVNSVFLRQGQSNEFSKKSPKERKEILASILGLDRYEVLRKAAQEKSKLLVQQKNILQARIEQATKEYAHYSTIQERLSATQQELHNLKQEESRLLSCQKTIEQTLKTYAQEQTKALTLTAELNHLQEQQIHGRTSLAALCTTWRSVRKATAAYYDPSVKQKLEERAQALQKIVSLRLTYTEKIAAITTELQERKTFCEKEINEHLIKQTQTLHAYELEKTRNETALEQLHNAQKACTTEIATLTKTLELYEQELLQHSLETTIQQFEKRKLFYHTFITKGNQYAAELKELQHKKMLAQHSDNATCSLCKQSLTTTQKHDMLASLSQRERILQRHIKRLSTLIPQLKNILVEQHNLIETLNKKKLETATIQEKKHTLTQEHEKKSQEIRVLTEKNLAIYKDIETLSQEITYYNHRKSTILTTDAACLALTKKLSELETEIALLSYNHDEYEALMIKIRTAQGQETLQQEHATQRALQNERRNRITTLCLELKKIKKLIAEKETAILSYAELPTEITRSEQELTTLTAQLQNIQHNKELLAAQSGALEEQNKLLIQRERDIAQCTKELACIDEEISDYSALVQALGKDGIQALLIEQAIPEIEAEANHLLAKLTDNQAHIMIESLKDLKSGGTKETLDIKISDTVGIRPYEFFSGGEAFRIDFALRIAISKLLAKRAGTSLQILMIDEGFGSQDEEGLSHIMDTLYKIQDDFAKILIVSHLPSMKDQFPTHFVVRKTPQGSTVSVIEQG